MNTLCTPFSKAAPIPRSALSHFLLTPASLPFIILAKDSPTHANNGGKQTMCAIAVRNARLEDAGRILEIYSHYIENTAITYEYTVPTLSEFQERMRDTMKRYPYLVIEAGGAIQGYAYAHPFVDRAAYDWSCAMSIYLAHDVRGRGLGGKLYAALEEALKDMGIRNLYACIAWPEIEDEYLNRNSAEFHAHIGYKKVGEFRDCAYKFGRWYNMIWMEKIIGPHEPSQEPIRNHPYE